MASMSILQKLGSGILHLASRWSRRRTLRQGLRGNAPSQDRAHAGNVRREEHADERTIRRAAEAELGGMSSEESRRAYENGENPGGLHHRGASPYTPRHEGRPEWDGDDAEDLRAAAGRTVNR